MDLSTSSNHSWTIKIDGMTYTVERLSMGDLAGIAQTFKDERRAAVEAAYDTKLKDAAPKAVPALEREKLNAVAAVEGPGPVELVGTLLSTIDGMVLVLTAALCKHQPDLRPGLVVGLAWSDELLLTAYELLGVKLKLVKKPDKPKGDKPPFPKTPTEGTG